MKNLLKYNFPNDLKTMSERELGLLAYEIREFLIEKVSKTGGHLASNLGVVELTIALHKIYNTPKDKIVWDVGHQSYVHKILTGRAQLFADLRQLEGLSGFPKREESPHDTFDSGHSSNSISAGLGLAKARDIKGEDGSVVVVIGDGALTGGIAYEGLNNAGHSGTDLTVILNDNEMSISKNIGGMSNHLSRLRANQAYNQFKKYLRKSIKSIPVAGDGIYNRVEHLRDTLKYAFVKGAIFEELGFKYFGPVDGHNVPELIAMLAIAKQVKGPVLVHVLTKKGKGLICAEKDPGKFHGVGPFNRSTFELILSSDKPSYSKVFGSSLAKLAETNPNIIAITAAMCDGTGLEVFRRKHPDKLFDAGIAEQHAVSFAAGLAINGMKPVVAIYSTFLQRAYDQIIMDVCLQKLPVVFCLDRGGNVGSDGETHHGIYDLSYLLHMPNMTVMAPKDGRELEAMLDYAMKAELPCAIRYPRGDSADFTEISKNYEINGKSEILIEGKDICIAAIGKTVVNAVKAAEILKSKGYDPCVINARFAKPLDSDTLIKVIGRTQNVLTVEDNTVEGGFGAGILKLLSTYNMNNIHSDLMGWPDQFIEQGTVSELEKRYGLDPESIADRAVKLMNR